MVSCTASEHQFDAQLDQQFQFDSQIEQQFYLHDG